MPTILSFTELQESRAWLWQSGRKHGNGIFFGFFSGFIEIPDQNLAPARGLPAPTEGLDMTVNVAINGFGRIGRNVLRAIVESGRGDIRVVAINDLGPVETNAHLLRFDSVHGRFPGEVKVVGDMIDVGDGPIKVTALRDPAELPHRSLEVDIALECSGIFTSKAKASAHLKAGAKRVLVSAPADDADLTVVYGVNHEKLKPEHLVVSNASCTTNCLVPVAKVLNDAIGIERGFMTTVHSYTGDQPTLDTLHRDLYRGRAAALSIIPTSTGAAKAVGLVLPELKGKLDGSSIRVPTPNVSMIDFKFVAKRATTPDEITDAVKRASEQQLKGILGFTESHNVSIDFNHDSRSSIFHVDQTRVIEGTFVRVVSWYDNEWAFSHRMSDTAVAMGKLG
jgi:glyceraldehyde 3-phosphate dehydrogenase